MDYEFGETTIIPSKTANEWILRIMALIALAGWIWFPPRAGALMASCGSLPEMVCPFPPGVLVLLSKTGEHLYYYPMQPEGESDD